MNIVDYVIIGIIGISVLFGLYRGFIASVLNMGCGLMSFLASFWVSPKLAAAVQSNQSFLNMLLHYTDASSRIGDLETAITNVATLTSQSINSILEKVNLPAPLDTLLRVNLENNVYASSGLSTVSDYVSQTILQASINIICFLVSFLVLYIVLAIVLNLLKAVFRFPILKQLKAAGDAGYNLRYFNHSAGSIPGTVLAVSQAKLGQLTWVAEWHPGQAETPKVDALAKAYKARTGKEFLAPRIEMTPRFLAAAINKAQSTDPVKIARALEDLTIDSVVGPVRMRGDDHQLLLPQVVNTIAPVDGKAVKVGWEGTNYGFRTDAAYTGNELAQGTDCKMARP